MLRTASVSYGRTAGTLGRRPFTRGLVLVVDRDQMPMAVTNSVHEYVITSCAAHCFICQELLTETAPFSRDTFPLRQGSE